MSCRFREERYQAAGGTGFTWGCLGGCCCCDTGGIGVASLDSVWFRVSIDATYYWFIDWMNNDLTN